MKSLAIISLWLAGIFSLLVFALIYLLNFKNHKSLVASSIILDRNNDILSANDIRISDTMNKSPQQDIRVIALHKFLSEVNSPLADYTDEIVQQADLNGLDYTFVPAIAMQESNGCKIIPVDSFNCWGFGIYGNKVMKFSSYKEAISKVSKTVKEAYIKNGLTNATLVEDRWTPSSRGQWSFAVNIFIGKIKDFERKLSAS